MLVRVFLFMLLGAGLAPHAAGARPEAAPGEPEHEEREEDEEGEEPAPPAEALPDPPAPAPLPALLPQPDACRRTGVRLVRSVGLQSLDTCRDDGQLGTRDLLTLEPGGSFEVRQGRRGKRNVLCLNIGSAPAAVRVQSKERPFFAAADGSPCVAEDGGAPSAWRCRGREGAEVRCVLVEKKRLRPRPPPSPTGPGGPSVFVLPFEGTAPEEARELAEQLVVAELSRQRLEGETLQVLSGRELDEWLSVKAERELMGCGSDDDGCFADISGALGARYLVHGRVQVLEDRVSAEIRLIDVRAGKKVGREVVDARDLFELSQRMKPTTRNLLAELQGRERETLPPPVLGRQLDDKDTLFGAGVAGATVCASAGCTVFLPASITGASLILSSSSPVWPFALLICPGPLCGLACGALAGMAGDLLFGHDVSFLRTALLALVGALGSVAVIALGTFVALVLVMVVGMPAWLLGLSPDLDSAAATWASPAAGIGLIGSTLLGSAILGVGAGLAFEFSLPLVEADPLSAAPGPQARELGPPPPSRVARQGVRY